MMRTSSLMLESDPRTACLPDDLGASPGVASAVRETRQIEVQSKSGSTGFSCGPDETILQAGLRQGVTLPYECATGTCGSCRARVGSGEVAVDWAEAPGHSRVKRDRGEILMCQTRPLTDCLVRVPANVGVGFPRHQQPRRLDGRVEVIKRLTHDVIHFELSLSQPLTFDAGQFVLLRVAGLEGMRAYSMVNFATETRRLELVVKRKPGGGFGDWLFDRAREGQSVEIFGPLGRATFHPDEDHNLLMIAGGSGIAGIMSILERAAEERYFESHKGFVFFGVRKLTDCFYLEQFSRHIASSHGNLKVTIALSDEDCGAQRHPSYPGVRMASGMVHEVCAKAMDGRYDNVMSYIAGPPPMVDGAIRSLVIGARATPDRIRYDKFG